MKQTDQIRVLLDQIDAQNGEVGGGDYQRPGYVAVRPTGASAAGVVHWWPEPLPNNGEGNAWGYITRCAYVVNPDTGRPFIPPEIVGAFLVSNIDGRAKTYPEVADRFLYPELWWDQAEVDRQKMMHDRDVEMGYGFSPGKTR